MTSGWFIQGIELPVAPSTESKAITRTLLQEGVFRGFPSLEQSKPTAYSYTLTGYIFGFSIIEQLEQLAKSADTEIVTVEPPRDRLHSTVLNTGVFMVTNFTVNRDKHTITERNGRTELVYKYTLVLSEFPDSGVNDNSIEVETTGGEEFVGTGDEFNAGGFIEQSGDTVDNFINILTDRGIQI